MAKFTPAGILCAALLSTTLAGCAGSTFEDANATASGNILSGLGIIPRPREQIDYRARAPLAAPPSTAALRTPAGQAIAARPANWPNDPDVARRERERAIAANPGAAMDQELRRAGPLGSGDFARDQASLPVTRSTGPDAPGSNVGPLSPQAMRSIHDNWRAEDTPASIFDTDPTAIPTPARGGPAQSFIEEQNASIRSLAEEQRNIRVDTTGLRAAEPERRRLTDPPSGFRRPAPD